MFAMGAGDRPLMRGMSLGELGYGMWTVGSWIVWYDAGGGVGARDATAYNAGRRGVDLGTGRTKEERRSE